MKSHAGIAVCGTALGETGVELQSIAVLPARGGDARQITPAGVFIYEYDWSPAGDRLAYIGAPPPGRDNWWTARLYTQTPGGAPKVTLDPALVGEGERFAKGVRLNMGYGDLRDILAGVDQVEAEYPIDDSRLGLTGWSYGGFMSMFAPTQTHRFKAAVVGAGLSNWESYYGENSIDQWMIPFFGASVYQDPKAYAKSSAIDFIQNDRTPSLIVVGEYDGECPAPQSFEYWHALRAMGVPTTLVVYAGEGHAFDEPQDERDVLERALRWFGKYLGTETAVQTAGIHTPHA